MFVFFAINQSSDQIQIEFSATGMAYCTKAAQGFGFQWQWKWLSSQTSQKSSSKLLDVARFLIIHS